MIFWSLGPVALFCKTDYKHCGHDTNWKRCQSWSEVWKIETVICKLQIKISIFHTFSQQPSTLFLIVLSCCFSHFMTVVICFHFSNGVLGRRIWKRPPLFLGWMWPPARFGTTSRRRVGSCWHPRIFTTCGKSWQAAQTPLRRTSSLRSYRNGQRRIRSWV